jgi:predicted amidohydrolase/GNAT superfamily N-acetyltransferase
MTVEIDNLRVEDYHQLLKVMKKAYSNWGGGFWSLDVIGRLISKFPEGQFVVKVDGKVAGCALAITVNYGDFGDNHTYAQITGNYSFDTHDPNGDTLYGVEVFIHPDHRGLRLGRRLYDARKDLCERLNLKAIVFGGRLPNYHKYADQYNPKAYIEAVKKKEIYDPVLTFQLANDFHVKKLLRNYMPEDEESQEHATLLQWDNVYYEAPHKRYFFQKEVVRIGLVQWQMRPYRSLDDMFVQLEFFVNTVSAYNADFLLMPESFNAPLLADFNHLQEADAMRKVAEFTPEIRRRFHELAVKFNINIICGSMPELDGSDLHNAGYLCHRNGKIDRYEKIHVTPDESKYWGMTGGDTLQVFETDAGRIGILICYDVEFPELSRILAEQGMEILFVPFLTDTQNAYYRVRHCAQARAIENECYVAISGSTGNLPKIKNMDIQYAQSAVLTPCDFMFPTNGIKSEATPNTEMVLIADVDLSLLKELHHYGGVKNLKDRRKDLYTVQFLPNEENKPTGTPAVKLNLNAG